MPACVATSVPLLVEGLCLGGVAVLFQNLTTGRSLYQVQGKLHKTKGKIKETCYCCYCGYGRWACFA